MRARELMTVDPASCLPGDTIREAARVMVERDCGCVPVVADRESGKLLGVVTDRDIAARAVALGLGPDTLVSEVMSVDPSCCHADSDVLEVREIMAERQVRRVPVIDAEGRCIGMVSQADLVRLGEGEVVERVSVPISEPRAEADVGLHPRT